MKSITAKEAKYKYLNELLNKFKYTKQDVDKLFTSENRKLKLSEVNSIIYKYREEKLIKMAECVENNQLDEAAKFQKEFNDTLTPIREKYTPEENINYILNLIK
jgi:valyl-tRNA synthetase